MRIRITYPLQNQRLTLRTEQDWEKDIQPFQSDSSGAEFELEWQSPNLSLKICLYDGETMRWSQGANYVLSSHDPDPHIYPLFYSPPQGSVSDVLHIGSGVGAHAIRIYHPPGYAENTLRRFPVVYMHDGQNLFFPEEAFAGNEWQVDETMDLLDEMNAIRKAIVIGISPSNRMREYTKPGYEDYGRFMTQKLKPMIDAQLRTRPQPENTVVMGSSLGGVAAFYLAWEYPHLFGKAACMSSTFGYQDDLFERVATSPHKPIRFYLDSGWPRDNYDATNAMRDLLVARGWRLGIDLLHFSFPEARHNERAWAGRTHMPFQFFLGRAWAASRHEK